MDQINEHSDSDSFCSPAVSGRESEEGEDRRGRELVRQHEGGSVPATDSAADDTQQETVQ